MSEPHDPDCPEVTDMLARLVAAVAQTVPSDATDIRGILIRPVDGVLVEYPIHRQAQGWTWPPESADPDDMLHFTSSDHTDSAWHPTIDDKSVFFQLLGPSPRLHIKYR